MGGPRGDCGGAWKSWNCGTITRIAVLCCGGRSRTGGADSIETRTHVGSGVFDPRLITWSCSKCSWPWSSASSWWSSATCTGTSSRAVQTARATMERQVSDITWAHIVNFVTGPVKRSVQFTGLWRRRDCGDGADQANEDGCAGVAHACANGNLNGELRVSWSPCTSMAALMAAFG